MDGVLLGRDRPGESSGRSVRDESRGGGPRRRVITNRRPRHFRGEPSIDSMEATSGDWLLYSVSLRSHRYCRAASSLTDPLGFVGSTRYTANACVFVSIR